MAQAVIAEIGARGRVVGPIALGAIGRRIAARVRHHRDGRAVVIIAVVVVAVAVIGAALIGV